MGDEENSVGSYKLTSSFGVLGIYTPDQVTKSPGFTNYYANNDASANIEGILEADYGTKFSGIGFLLHLIVGDPPRATQPIGGELKVGEERRRFDWPQGHIILRFGPVKANLGRIGNSTGPEGVGLKDSDALFLDPWSGLSAWTVMGGILSYEPEVNGLEVVCKAGLTFGQDRIIPKEGNSIPYIVANCGFAKPNFKSPTVALTVSYEGGPDREKEPDMWRHLGDLKLVWNPNSIFNTKIYSQCGVENYLTGARKFCGGSAMVRLRPEGALSFLSFFFRAAMVYDEYVRTPYFLSAVSFTGGIEFKIGEKAKLGIYYDLLAPVNGQKIEGVERINRFGIQLLLTDIDVKEGIEAVIKSAKKQN